MIEESNAFIFEHKTLDAKVYVVQQLIEKCKNNLVVSLNFKE